MALTKEYIRIINAIPTKRALQNYTQNEIEALAHQYLKNLFMFADVAGVTESLAGAITQATEEHLESLEDTSDED